MMESLSQRIVIGKFGKTHGLNGWLRVISFTNPAANIFEYSPWYVSVHGQYEIVTLCDNRMQNGNLMVLIERYNAPEAAQAFTNLEIFIDKTTLPQLTQNEYYWKDLEGLNVVNQDNIALGKVDYLFNSGSNDILVIEGEKTYLIPFLRDQFVKQIDMNEKVIHVEWDADF